MDVEAHAGARAKRSQQMTLCPKDVLSGRHLDIALVAFDHGHGKTGGFGHRGVVGHGVALETAMRLENAVEHESLRRLRAVESTPVHGLADEIALDPLQRIRDRQSGHGALMPIERPDHAPDHVFIGERAGAIVDQHLVRRPFQQAFQPETARILTRCTAGDRRHQVQAGSRFLIERSVIGMDDDAHPGDIGVIDEPLHRVPKEMLAAKPGILFRNLAAETLPAPRRDDDGNAACHTRSLPLVRRRAP